MIYLDNSATTLINEEVLKKIQETSINSFGNPSSLHNLGFTSEQLLKQSKSIFEEIFDCKSDELIFTSGGTESDNLALIGYCMANKKRGNHIISTQIEHDAVYNTLEFLNEIGFEVTLLKPNKNGAIDKEELKNNIKEATILVSIMHVNNETGAKNDIQKLSSLVKSLNPNIAFHSDCVQSFGKYIMKNIDADMISVSSHKIHGPKGVGLLYKKNNIKISPIIYGGGQQNNLRSGTENVPSICGFSLASKIAYDNINNRANALNEIKSKYISGIRYLNDKYGKIKVLSNEGELGAPHIINIVFSDIRSEVMLHSLEEDEIYVGSGSACSIHKKEKSRTLQAIGVIGSDLDSSIRISLGDYNTIDEVDMVISALDKKIPLLRKFTRK